MQFELFSRSSWDDDLRSSSMCPSTLSFTSPSAPVSTAAGPIESLGRYRGGFSTAISSNGRLEPLLDYGITVGYHHQWNDKLYTILVYNYGGVEKNEFQLTSDIKSLSYYAMDLCYEFIKNGVLGIEYLNGFRQDVSLNKGKANRLQFSVKYTFN